MTARRAYLIGFAAFVAIALIWRFIIYSPTT